MPVTFSFLPKDFEELCRKIKENKPGEEAQLLKDVKTHLGLSGSSVYRQNRCGIVELQFLVEKYTVFLIQGKIKVAEENYDQELYAYKVVGEKVIQLYENTAVVIVNEA